MKNHDVADPKSAELQEVIVNIVRDAVAGRFDPSSVGFDRASMTEWVAAGKAPVRDLFTLLEFFARDGNPTSGFHAGSDLLSSFFKTGNAQPAWPENPGAGTVTVKELGIVASQLCIPPKIHAVVEALPAIWSGQMWDGGVAHLTLPFGPRMQGPFQCSYVGAGGPNNIGVALSLASFVAAKKFSVDPHYEAPQALVKAASSVPAMFVAPPDSFMDSCVAANERGLVAAQQSARSKPTFWDLRSQVLASSSDVSGPFTIDDMLDTFYRRNKGRKAKFEENARWIVKKLLDGKQFPADSIEIMNLAQQLAGHRAVDEGLLADAKSYAGAQTKKGTDPLARLTLLSPRAHKVLIKFRVQDTMEIASAPLVDVSWLAVRNRLAIFTNLVDDGFFAMLGVKPEAVGKWWDDVLRNRGRGQITLYSLDGLVGQCEKEIASEAITDVLEIKHVVNSWCRKNVPWLKAEVAMAMAEKQRRVEQDNAQAEAVERIERLAYWKRQLPVELDILLEQKENFGNFCAECQSEAKEKEAERARAIKEHIKRAAQWYTVSQVSSEETYLNVARAALSEIKACLV